MLRTQRASVSLILDALMATATAAVFAYVGWIFSRRPASRDARRARDAFSMWWYGLAIVTAIGGARSALGAAGIEDLGLHLALSYTSLLPLTAALFGLLYYLLFIHTGRQAYYAPLAVGYAGLFLVFVWLITWQDPQRVVLNEWNVTMENARTLSSTATAVLLVVLLGPVLAAAALYGSLAFRSDAPIVRYRVGMTSGAFLLWFGSSAVAAMTGLTSLPYWPLASRAIGLIATLLVLAAYRPPKFVRAKLEPEQEGEGGGRTRGPIMLSPMATLPGA